MPDKKYYIVKDIRTQEGGLHPYKMFNYPIWSNPMHGPPMPRDNSRVVIASAYSPTYPTYYTTKIRNRPFIPGTVDLTDNYPSVIVGPPIYHMPKLVSSMSLTTIEISFGGKVLYKIRMPYKLIRRVLNDIYKESVFKNGTSKRTRLKIIVPGLSAVIYISMNSLSSAMKKISTKYVPAPLFENKDDQKIFITEVEKIIEEAKN